jgi:1-acyl-sn-glycerol-3-phosphate acyltransferase
MEMNNNTKNQSKSQLYVHSRWEKQRRFLRFLLRTIAFTLLVKLDRVEGLDYVPQKGPAIIYINHIAFVDPIIVLHVIHRNIVPLAKIEVYDYPVIGIFPKIWGVIPVQRESFDRRAIQKAMAVLNAGEIVLVAPEGTRNPCMEPGKEGLAYLAIHCGAPLVPCAVSDSVGYPTYRYSKRWQGSGIKLRFGRPFYFRSDKERPDRDALRLMTDEAMYILADLLPASLRGYYQDLSLATQKTIEWL